MNIRRFTSAVYRHSPKRVRYMITRTKAFVRERFIDPKRIPLIQKEVHYLAEQISNKEKLNFYFVVPLSSQWKHDILYRKLDKDPRFNVKVLVVPSNSQLSSDVQAKYHKALSEMKEIGYEPVETIRRDGSLLPFETLDADILFYITPYDVMVASEYQIKNTYKTALLCYSRYGYLFDTTRQWHINSNFGYLWQIFLSSKSDEMLYRKYSTFGGTNGFALGPILIDNLREAASRIRPDEIPLVIIAPHHSIEPWGYALSNFLKMSDYFLTLPVKYAGRLHFAFKPHPHLKAKLYDLSSWGKAKTDRYYEFWRSQPGCELHEGTYAELFARSSAMVHDCSAFCLEYQLCNKPALFIRRNHRVPPHLDEVGSLAFSLHTMADSVEDIDRFLDLVATRSISPDQELQQLLCQRALPYGTRSVSDIIVKKIKTRLGLKEEK